MRDKCVEMSENENKMRDRLVKILHEMPKERTIGECADYLLANGVVVPTFNIGDKVWFVPKGLKEVCEATVVRIEYNYFTNPQEWLVIDYFSSIVGKQEYKSRIDLMLNKTVFRTKEEAERALKGGE